MFKAQRFLNLADFEAVAHSKLPRRIFEFIEGGSEENASLRANRAAFADYSLQTRVLVDTSNRSCAVNLFGRQWAAPFGIAPMGAMGLAAFQADLVLARAAAKAGIIQHLTDVRAEAARAHMADGLIPAAKIVRHKYVAKPAAPAE